MDKTNKIRLKGKIIGFEEFTNYLLESPFGKSSPFRLLSCTDENIAFIVINPYSVLNDYSFCVDDSVFRELQDNSGKETIGVLCIVIVQDKNLYVNLRSPLIINTATGKFTQIILQNEKYSISFPINVHKNGKNKK